MQRFVIALTMMFLFCSANAQNDTEQDYYKPEYIRFSDHVYVPSIKTVLLYRSGWEMSPPVISLQSNEKLRLEFDDFEADVKSYKVSVVHCDANWQPSDLEPSEYLEGFYDDDINDYEFSYNTTRAFTHYYIDLPSDYLRFTKSGNYLLRVFLGEDNDDNVIITRRFMISDPKVSLRGSVTRPVNVSEREEKQSVDFVIRTGNYYISDPFTKLKVILRQNGRWDNILTGLKPKMAGSTELDFRLIPDNVFNGINEYRNFDIKSLKYNSERIRKIEYDADGYHVYLWPDERRTFKRYTFEKDINGRKFIESEGSTNQSTESDYVWVHFTLPYDFPLVNGNLYILGDLTDWQFSEEGMMKYDFEKHVYEGKLYLKQGYYNYLFVFLEDGRKDGDAALIEGTHSETENDYTVYVYYRAEGSKYDELIGIEFFNSLIKK